MTQEILQLKGLDDLEAKELLAKHNIGLTVEEARKIEDKILGRPMTLTEATVWSIEGSEHCSYKSSRQYLKILPKDSPNVILGPEEDAGIVEILKYNGVGYGIVMGHESHNHPSQLVPYEGAATGIGGIVRDICCMGAKVIAVADPLRFGDISKNKSKWIAKGVVDGIGGYGNPIGVPNIAGDVYWNSSFNENCLVNVVSLGLVKSNEIIHSYAPQGAGEGNYDMILVGKPTDNSGFGGASFASFELDETEKEKNKGAVQEPNAFLKRHLLESTDDLFDILKEKRLLDRVGFKDLGGGGLICVSVELVDSAGYGAEIDIDKVHVSMDNLAPQVILCAETQERFMWVAHPDVTQLILDHYNKKWALGDVSKGAAATVIGRVTDNGRYVAKYSKFGNVIDAKARDITEGLKYDRPVKAPKVDFKEPLLEEPLDYNQVLLKLLSHENIASRECIYEKYDKSVQGNTIIESGQADAGVIAPLLDNDELPQEAKKTGVALSVDSNPLYARISPYWGAVNAVIEAMRNVSAVGAMPWAITDCLNYGNPEKPEQMWEFVEGVRGVANTCQSIHLKEYPDSPVPVISGNVSLYNESKNGSVDPSAIIACLGKINYCDKAITMEFKQPGSSIFLLGKRKDELGGSVYYQLFDELGANVPKPDFKESQNQMYAIIDMIDNFLLQSCHDISDGGLSVTLAEMCFGGNGKNKIGCEIILDKIAGSESLNIDKKLFSETGGFIFETTKPEKVKEILDKYNLEFFELGKTTDDSMMRVYDSGKKIIDVSVENIAGVWLGGLRGKLS